MSAPKPVQLHAIYHDTLVTNQHGYELVSVLQAYTVTSLDTLVTSQPGFNLVSALQAYMVTSHLP